MNEFERKLVVVVKKQEISVPKGMELSTFSKFLEKHGLTTNQSLQVIEMEAMHKTSVSYIGRLLQKGFSLDVISVVHQIRDELGTLHIADSSRKGWLSECQLPLKKGCKVLRRLQCDDEEFDEDDIEAIIGFFLEIADRSPSILTWSSIIDQMTEIFDCLEEREDYEDLSRAKPSEKISRWLEIIGGEEILSDQRLSL